jgi:hypothetical protein
MKRNEQERKKYFANKLKECGKAYNSGHVGMVLVAFEICYENQMPCPQWLYDAVLPLLKKKVLEESDGRMGQHSHWINQHCQDLEDTLSYMTIWNLRKNGIRGIESFFKAAIILSRDWPNSDWTFDKVRNGYNRFRVRIKDNPHRYSFTASIMKLKKW